MSLHLCECCSFSQRFFLHDPLGELLFTHQTLLEHNLLEEIFVIPPPLLHPVASVPWSFLRAMYIFVASTVFEVLFSWLVGWLVGCSVGRSAGWLVGWLASRLVGWLVWLTHLFPSLAWHSRRRERCLHPALYPPCTAQCLSQNKHLIELNRNWKWKQISWRTRRKRNKC